MGFARRVFLSSGLYGVLIMAPQFFLPYGGTNPEMYYGFVGAVFAWQLTSLLIAREPARLRPVMLPSGLGKAIFGAAVVALWAQGRAPAFLLAFAAIDVLFALLFLEAWRRTRPAPALFS